MNKLLLLVMTFILYFQGYGQNDSLVTQIPAPTITDTIVERLVAMAMENPQIRTVENQAIQSEYDFTRSRTAWLNNITVAGNLNEVSIKRGITVDPLLRQSTQYPRYNIGVVLPVGLFVNNKKQTKANYHKYLSVMDQVDVEKRNIRRLVAGLYADYLMYQELITLQQELLQDAKVVYDKSEMRFEKAEISLEDFSTANRTYNAEKVREVTLKHALGNTEIQLEALIGMKLIDALQQISVQIR